MLGAFVFFSYTDNLFVRVLLILAPMLFLVFSFLKPYKRYIGKLQYKVAAVMALAAILASVLYFDLWFYAEKRFEDEVTAEGQIVNIERKSYYDALTVRTDNINGALLSKYKIIVYVNKSDYNGYFVGDEIEFSGTFDEASSHYVKDGISGVMGDLTSFKNKGSAGFPLEYRISSYRKLLSRKLIYHTDSDAGGLLSALLLGEKELLPEGSELDFRRIGISHILALSGLHLSILTAAISKFLMMFGVNKKISVAASMLFTAIYIALTGFPSSVMRAGFMLILYSALFLLSKTHDSLTSLFVSVCLICIFEPYAIYDIALWLSAFATLGIVVISEYYYNKYRKLSVWRWIFTSLLSSFAAICATFAIMTFKFSEFSLLSIFSTLVFSILVEAAMVLGLVVLIFGALLPIKFILAPLCSVIIKFAALLSNINWIYVSSDFSAIKMLSLIVTLAFFAFFIFEIKHKKAVLCSIFAAMCVTYAVSAVATYAVQNRTDIIYHDNISEKLYMKQDGEITLINIGSLDEKNAYNTAAELSTKKLTYLNKYIVTRYSYYLDEHLEIILKNTLVDEIYLHRPRNQDEINILKSIYLRIGSYRSKIKFYDDLDVIYNRDMAIIPVYNSPLGDKVQNLITVSYKNEFYTYTSNTMLSGEYKRKTLEIIDGSRAIIFGRQGSGYSFDFTYKFRDVKIVLINNKNIVIHSGALEYYADMLYTNEYKLSLIR
jgi:ComEC/Rec2-related protein